MRRTILIALAGLVVLAACGGGGKKKVAAVTTTTSTTVATTTTAPTLAAGASPLTGLPGAKARPALVVKIDNAPKARPQTGLNQADIVIEEKVEDGVTRFFTIFQSQDSDPVGPVRSARTTDITLVTPLNHPLFAYSGTNATFQKLINAAPLVDVGYDANPGLYNRTSNHPAPYNLYSSTPRLYQKAAAAAPTPPPLFPYRPEGQPLTSSTATPASHLHLEFIGVHVRTVVDYTWDAAAGVWRRAQDGGPHVDSANAQVSPKNVVVEFVQYVDTGQRDRSNTAVPEGKVIGSGEAWILTDGKVVKGTWSKPSAEAVPTYTDASGAPVPLTPGQTWLELPPPGSGQVS